MKLKIKKLRPGAYVPERATAGAAGMDLRACLEEEELSLEPLERRLVPTGIALELPGPQYAALIYARSGLALREGLAMANGVGLVDSDYRGELCVPVVNLSQKTLVIKNGERVAQLVLAPVCIPREVEVCQELADTPRGAGGFGSTGKA